MILTFELHSSPVVTLAALGFESCEHPITIFTDTQFCPLCWASNRLYGWHGGSVGVPILLTVLEKINPEVVEKLLQKLKEQGVAAP